MRIILQDDEGNEIDSIDATQSRSINRTWRDVQVIVDRDSR